MNETENQVAASCGESYSHTNAAEEPEQGIMTR